MKLQVVPTLLVGLLLAAAPAKPEARGDPEALQGTWTVVSAEDSGREWPIQGHQVQITNDKIVLKKGDTVQEEWGYKLDPSKSPKWIDLTIRKAGPFPGIYELKGDDLIICFNETPPERSTEFVSKPNSPNDILITLKRTKAE